jgi:hypothetical protein
MAFIVRADPIAITTNSPEGAVFTTQTAPFETPEKPDHL